MPQFVDLARLVLHVDVRSTRAGSSTRSCDGSFEIDWLAGVELGRERVVCDRRSRSEHESGGGGNAVNFVLIKTSTAPATVRSRRIFRAGLNMPNRGMRRPPSRRRIRSQRRGQPRVVRRDDRGEVRSSRCISRSRACSASAGLLRRDRPVGSSASSSAGFMTSARADGDALLLAARQHAGPVREPLAEPDAARAAPRRAGAPRAIGTPRDAHRHLGVLERGELGQQVVELEDEPDVPVAERDDARRRASSSSSCVVDRDRCRDRRDRARRARAAACSSPRPSAPTIATISPASTVEVEIAQHGQHRAADRIALDDAAGFEKSHQSTAKRKSEADEARREATCSRLAVLTLPCDFRLLISQRLRRIEARGLSRRIDRRDEADDDRRDDDQREVARQDCERHVRHLIDVDRHAESACSGRAMYDTARSPPPRRPSCRRCR